jgi:hypothetical protein
MTRMSCFAQQYEWLPVTAGRALRLQKWAEMKSYYPPLFKGSDLNPSESSGYFGCNVL